MIDEKGYINLDGLLQLEILGVPFGYKSNSNPQNTTKDLVVIPYPNEVEKFNEGTKVFSYETLQLLQSKFYFGINQRSQMIEVLYNTFEDLFNKEDKEIDDFLTLQVLYSEMIIKLGTILEDFAGMCFACREYKINQSDIARTFLSYSDPISFYESIKSKNGKRKIKQIFDLPESKGQIKKLINNSTDDEVEVVWKAVQNSTELIGEKLEFICSAIVRNSREDMTCYDMYNKIKHGFSPVYPFVTPVPMPIGGVPENVRTEEIIYKYFFESVMIMHNQLGQQDPTPAFTYQEINLTTAQDIREVVRDISFLYKHLMKKYLRIAESNKEIYLLLSEGQLTEEEKQQVFSIITDKDRYIF